MGVEYGNRIGLGGLMNPHYLVSMINDISRFYVTQGSLDEAAAQVESHIARFWEKRMRNQIIDHLRSGGEGLSEVSRAAVALLVREGDAAPLMHTGEDSTG
jgi:formate dehydrogenase subunit delta